MSILCKVNSLEKINDSNVFVIFKCSCDIKGISSSLNFSLSDTDSISLYMIVLYCNNYDINSI